MNTNTIIVVAVLAVIGVAFIAQSFLKKKSASRHEDIVLKGIANVVILYLRTRMERDARDPMVREIRKSLLRYPKNQVLEMLDNTTNPWCQERLMEGYTINERIERLEKLHSAVDELRAELRDGRKGSNRNGAKSGRRSLETD